VANKKRQDGPRTTGPRDFCGACPAKGENHKHCGFAVECTFPHSWYCVEQARMYDALQTKYHTLSDSYLRIRGLLGAFDTIKDPRDLVNLTETRLKELIIKAKNNA